MNSKVEITDTLTNFRIKTTMSVAIFALILLTPFAINHFYQGRYIPGSGALLTEAIFAATAWNCSQHRYNPHLVFWGVVPAITLFIVLSLLEQGAMISYWSYPALLVIYFMLPAPHAWVANALFLGVVYTVAWNILDYSFMIRFVITSLGVSALAAIFIKIITEQQKMLEDQAFTDPLTGLYNRMLLEDTLVKAIEKNHQFDSPMTLIALDLDHFKLVNDELGHAGGDRVLRGVGKFLKKHVRNTDKIFRIGGEEFLILLFNTNAEDGLKLAEKLCRSFSSQSLIEDRPITVSVGVATLQTGEDWEKWMKRCDEKLYQAKQDGRNLVVS
ncbi:MAG: GGDEF domain-containing protein [Pseudomonadota bacterium]|nr:GGDEF domain-containing protein [Pseudomonadota bacterium]